MHGLPRRAPHEGAHYYLGQEHRKTPPYKYGKINVYSFVVHANSVFARLLTIALFLLIRQAQLHPDGQIMIIFQDVGVQFAYLFVSASISKLLVCDAP